MSRKAFGILGLLFLCSPAGGATSSAKSDWSLRAPLPLTNSETGVAELDGKIYVIGGYPSDRKTVATVQMYDSRTDKWQIVAPLPVALNHVMPAATNGKIFVIGGQTTEQSDPDKAGFVNSVYEYDPVTNKSSARATMPTARSGGAAAVVMARFTLPAEGRRADMILPSMTRKKTNGPSFLTYQRSEIV